MSEQVDVLIVGSGSAGLCAATYLAQCGIKSFKCLERRPGPMERGQADGVQCRTVEVYESFGIAEDLKREAYHVLEVCFWSSDDGGTVEGRKAIQRARTAADTLPGLSHQPHVILNQARMHDLLIQSVRSSGGPEVEYGWEVKAVEVDKNAVADPNAYCVSVKAEKRGQEQIFRARYLLGCDGAHSVIRKSLGFQMIGDSTDSVWGVMDVYPQTDFPDVRKKVSIRSEAGSLLIIPREGGSLARFYIELSEDTGAQQVTLEELQQAARNIFHPYQMEFADTIWWSVYRIGQRLADHFTESNRVFLTGDACHTHSPKAGQGMNVSLQDGYNVAWKLAQVLKGQVNPELVATYVLERQKVASDLIEFDRWFTKIFSSKSKTNGVTAKDFSDAFIKSGRYMAGLTSVYQDSTITNAGQSKQDLAKNLVVGMRVPSTQVVRFCDARAIQFLRAFPADGRWRIVIFPGDIREQTAVDRLAKLAEYLSSSNGPVRTFTPDNADIDSFIEPIVVLAGKRAGIEQEQIPQYFWPVTGQWRMRGKIARIGQLQIIAYACANHGRHISDLHKVFVDDESYNSGHGHAYEFYQVDPREGAVAIVRPDQHVSMVVGLDDLGLIGDFFAGFAVDARQCNGVSEAGDANGIHGGETNHALDRTAEEAG